VSEIAVEDALFGEVLPPRVAEIIELERQADEHEAIADAERGQADAKRWEAEPGPPYRGVVVIEWPAPVGGSVYACMIGRDVKITDAATGKPFGTCSNVTVHADPGALVTADLTLLADKDGEPLLDGRVVTRDGEPLTGVFPFVVAEMRVRER